MLKKLRLPRELCKKTAMDSNHHAPVRRECVSVGSVCVLGEPWLELLANHFLLLQLLLLRLKLFWGCRCLVP